MEDKQAGPVWPLMRGDWKALSDEESTQFIERLDQVLSRSSADPPFTRRFPVRGLRALPLSFYPGWLLVEGEAQLADDLVGTFDVLYGPRFMWVIDGASGIIHALNGGRLPADSGSKDGKADAPADEAAHSFLPSPLAALDLTTAADYLRFFCGAVWGDDGPFRLIESLDDPDLAAAPDDDGDDDSWRKQIQPVAMQSTPEGMEAQCVVCYGSALFTTRFRVEVNGMVQMLDDEPAGTSHGEERRHEAPFHHIRKAPRHAGRIEGA